MLAHECVRKLIERWGSRLGASRSATRRTPPRFGVWASARPGLPRSRRLDRIRPPTSSAERDGACRIIVDPPHQPETVDAGTDPERATPGSGPIMRGDLPMSTRTLSPLDLAGRWSDYWGASATRG